MAGLRAYNYFCTAFVSILDKKKRGYMEKFTYGFILDEFDVDLAGLFTVTCWFGQTSKINKNTTQLSLNLDFRQFTPIPTVFPLSIIPTITFKSQFLTGLFGEFRQCCLLFRTAVADLFRQARSASTGTGRQQLTSQLLSFSVGLQVICSLCNLAT